MTDDDLLNPWVVVRGWDILGSRRIGKVFDEDELRAIGKVAGEFNCIILADEVVSYIE